MTVPISELVEGDIVRFKGTRDHNGYRKIYKMSKLSYTSIVLVKNRQNGFDETPYMSQNGIDNLTHVLVEDTWIKIVQ